MFYNTKSSYQKNMLTQKGKEYFIFGIYQHKTMKGTINNVFNCVTSNFFSFEKKGYIFAHTSCHQIIF